MCHALRSIWILAALALTLARPTLVVAQETPFPVLTGLEGAVEFWKQIFTRYSFAEVVLFDPVDPGTIYSALQAPDNEAGRALIDKERARVVVDYDLADDESRIRGQRGAKEHFLEGVKISGRYIDEMKKIFRAEGLPVELAYLPLVESSFNIRARSAVGAVGMWQFMPDTGKKFMRIDAKIDERRDPFASTKAAARLLKENYRLLGNWPLAITAYNHGTDGIFRGMKTVESDNLVDLIRRYQSPMFGFASKNFYAEFLAVVEIATHTDAYFPFLRAHRPLTFGEVAMKRQAPLHAVLKPAAISQSDFFDWNPALDPAVKVIPSGYRVKLPLEKVADFVAAERRVKVTPTNTHSATTLKIRQAKTASLVRAVKTKPASKVADRSRPIAAAPKTPPAKITTARTKHVAVKVAAQ
ncbi:MAG TPA: lytic transglycosylase domain-containing protein [Candidatus Binatia bacterium]